MTIEEMRAFGAETGVDVFDGAPAPWVKFDPATGAILEWGVMARGVVALLARRDGNMLQGVGRADTHRVDLATLTLVPLT